jgi:biofilm PGA synthesis N-glycosyltransferase PgaC
MGQMILWSLLFISVGLFAWMFVGYPLALWLVSKVYGRDIVREPIRPFVTIIVCTYNEANVIERRIHNLVTSEYPAKQLEIIVVDSASQDGTADLVQALLPKYPDHRIRLIQEDSRRGKVSAINLGLAAASGDIVILTDGPTVFWRDTIRLVVENFADPAIGAATGDFVKYDLEEAADSQETEWLVFRFRKVLRRLESVVDSTTWLSGELTAFRRDLMPVIPPDVTIDDAHIAMAVRKQGHRVVVDERAKYAEKRPTVYVETVIVKKKSIAGGIREMVRFRKMLLNPKYKLYGILILPARLLHFYLNPFLLLLIAIGVGGLTLLQIGIVPVLAAILGVLALLLLLSLYRRGALIRPLIAFLLMEWIILAGIWEYVTGRYSGVWQQVSTSRS